MVTQDGLVESSALGRWSEALGELHGRIGHRFCRSEARERAKRYPLGLLGRVERKNGWQMVEAIGERNPQGVRRLLNAARWDADDVRDDLRSYVVEHLGDEGTGVLIVDETGFLKKGRKSVGVARRYTGTAGDTVNRQVGVFLAYASEKGAAFVDRAPYLPKAWTNDPARRAVAGVPEELAFGNKVELAEGMLERAFSAGVPARWVVADSFYGRLRSFREWLEERGRPYAVMVPRTNAVPLGGRKKKVGQHVERLPEDAFSEVRPARNDGGRRPWEWACLDLEADPEEGMRRWLLVRGSTDDPNDPGFYQAYGPEGTTVEELVGVCQDRWAVEECFAEAKGEAGMDRYEVRRREAWHRHVTLSLPAHAFLAVVRSAAREEDAGRGPKRGPRRGPDPADRAGGQATGARHGRTGATKRFLLGWSAWRRTHQAVAARCRRASRAAKRAALGREGPPEVATIAPEGGARLADERWDLVRPLLPPQRGGVGRPPNDHRAVLGGILWVARTGSSWREMPEEYGDFTTAYKRWRLWKERGLWRRIVEVLGHEELPGPATNDLN